jgi:serine/threonine protein kinase
MSSPEAFLSFDDLPRPRFIHAENLQEKNIYFNGKESTVPIVPVSCNDATTTYALHDFSMKKSTYESIVLGSEINETGIVEDGKLCLVKIINMKKLEPCSGLFSYNPFREIAAMQFLSNESHLTTEMSSIYTEKDHHLYQIHNYDPEAIDLFSFLEHNPPLNPPTALKIFQQIVQAVAGIHQHDYAHRALSLNTILYSLSTQQITLTEFSYLLPKHYPCLPYYTSKIYAAPETKTSMIATPTSLRHSSSFSSSLSPPNNTITPLPPTIPLRATSSWSSTTSSVAYAESNNNNNNNNHHHHSTHTVHSGGAHTHFFYNHQQTDIWALGILLYMLLTRHTLFTVANIMDVRYRRYLQYTHSTLDRQLQTKSLFETFITSFHPEFKEKFGNEIVELLNLCLAIEPELRPTCIEILQHRAFQHL